MSVITPEGWTLVPREGFNAWWLAQHPDVEPPRCFERGSVSVFLTREPIWRHEPDNDVRCHLAISCADKLPTWDQIIEAAHALRPDVCFVISVPPRSWWMNAHPYTLHLCETRDEALVVAWREQRAGHAPT